MFRDPRPLLDNGTMRELKQLARDGFATVMAMDDPETVVTVRRWDDQAEDFVIIGIKQAVVRRDQQQADQGLSDESTDISTVSGTIRAFAPWDIRIGDRVTLPDGNVLVVAAPAPYERFGVIRVRWTAEEGAP